jgi:hypothetical protein
LCFGFRRFVFSSTLLFYHIFIEKATFAHRFFEKKKVLRKKEGAAAERIALFQKKRRKLLPFCSRSCMIKGRICIQCQNDMPKGDLYEFEYEARFARIRRSHL